MLPVPTKTRSQDPQAVRRGTALLAVLTAVPIAALMLDATVVWPLLLVPVAFSSILAGVHGLALTSAVTALGLAMAAAEPGTSGAQMTVGLIVAVVLALVVGARHEALTRELDRASAESLTDRLTGLPNYAFLADTLPRELRRADRYGLDVSVLLLDIDHFKRFNDRFGHAQGNRLLAKLGGVLMACARASDFPCRFGGEEFVIIVPGPASEAAEAAERIRSEVAGSRLRIDGATVSVTVSIGIASHQPGDAVDGTALLERADRALYAAKRAGRDRSMALVDGAEPVPATRLLASGSPEASGRQPRVRRIA